MFSYIIICVLYVPIPVQYLHMLCLNEYVDICDYIYVYMGIDTYVDMYICICEGLCVYIISDGQFWKT